MWTFNFVNHFCFCLWFVLATTNYYQRQLHHYAVSSYITNYFHLNFWKGKWHHCITLITYDIHVTCKFTYIHSLYYTSVNISSKELKQNMLWWWSTWTKRVHSPLELQKIHWEARTSETGSFTPKYSQVSLNRNEPIWEKFAISDEFPVECISSRGSEGEREGSGE